ncbi:hypothetical protein KE639_00582 [Streptomyces sp. V17-9]|nr:hypothetical protein KE639_00582 [Streptomyces sp. V17-9]
MWAGCGKHCSLPAQLGFHIVGPYLRGHGPTAFLSPSTPRSGQQAALGADVLALMDASGVERAYLAARCAARAIPDARETKKAKRTVSPVPLGVTDVAGFPSRPCVHGPLRWRGASHIAPTCGLTGSKGCLPECSPEGHGMSDTVLARTVERLQSHDYNVVSASNPLRGLTSQLPLVRGGPGHTSRRLPRPSRTTHRSRSLARTTDASPTSASLRPATAHRPRAVRQLPLRERAVVWERRAVGRSSRTSSSPQPVRERRRPRPRGPR